MVFALQGEEDDGINIVLVGFVLLLLIGSGLTAKILFGYTNVGSAAEDDHKVERLS